MITPNVLRSFFPRPLMVLFLLAFLPASAGIAQDSIEKNARPKASAHHTVAISFDLDQALVIGTSKIDLPAGRSLHLDCGQLTITGATLEQQGHTPARIRPTKNDFVIAPCPVPQTLFISWTLAAVNPQISGNLISEKGITLAGFWHPMAEQDMLFELSAHLPRGFIAVSEGNQVNGKARTHLYHAQVPYPLQSLHFAAGPYKVRARKIGPVTIKTLFFAEDNTLAPAYLDKAVGYIKRYQKLIGPFPYPEYKIVENRLPTGYGMPGFTLLGQTVVRLPFIKDTSLGHEILHSWFGNSIGLAQSGGNWCEGLTTYLADQSFAMDAGKGSEYRKNQVLRYLAYVHSDNSMALKDFTGAGDGRPMARKIRAIGYDKGSMVFHMLEKEIGRENFTRGLRELYRTRKFKRVSWQDIEDIFSRVSGKDLALFFDQWLQRTDIPKLRIARISVSQKNGRSITRFHLIQENKVPYSLQVKVVVRGLTETTTTTLKTDQLDREFSLSTDSLPSLLVLDPDYDLMRGLDNDEIPPTLSRFLGADNKTMILPDKKQEAGVYQPLADLLGRMGVEIKRAGELHNADLARGSFLFAGDSELRTSMFGNKKSRNTISDGHGFGLLVRKNPLDIEQTMVLVDSDSRDETEKAARKILHYGRYGRLMFQNGKIREKSVEQSDNGLVYELLPPPDGMPVRAAEQFSAIMDEIANSRIIYVGETHTAYGDHLLQLQVLQAMYAKNTNVTVGMEMFPRSSQAALDDYINGTIRSERDFLKKSHYFSVWGFDYRLYRDIIGFCKKHKIRIIGLNLDKKTVSTVFATGNTDTLSPEQQQQMAQVRDLDVPGYRKRLRKIFSQHGFSPHGGNKSKKFRGFLQAQAIWDETMAESIADSLAANPGSQMIVIAGAGHVYKDSAIPLRVERRMPHIRQSVLVSDNGRDTGLEQGKKVDYLLFTRPRQLAPAAKIGVMLEEKNANGEKGQVIIVGISPHGFGKKAGLKKGDVILAIDNIPVHEVADLKIALLDKHPGERVQLKVFRKRDVLPDKTMEIPVKLTGMPMDMMMPPNHPKK